MDYRWRIRRCRLLSMMCAIHKPNADSSRPSPLSMASIFIAHRQLGWMNRRRAEIPNAFAADALKYECSKHTIKVTLGVNVIACSLQVTSERLRVDPFLFHEVVVDFNTVNGITPGKTVLPLGIWLISGLLCWNSCRNSYYLIDCNALQFNYETLIGAEMADCLFLLCFLHFFMLGAYVRRYHDGLECRVYMQIQHTHKLCGHYITWKCPALY